MLTANIAIVAPVTEADDRAAREVVWQQVTERIVPQMGKLCTRFEPSGGAWGQKLSAPYSVVLGKCFKIKLRKADMNARFQGLQNMRQHIL